MDFYTNINILNSMKNSDDSSNDQQTYDQLYNENKYLHAQLKCKDDTIEMLSKVNNGLKSSNESLKATNHQTNPLKQHIIKRIP